MQCVIPVPTTHPRKLKLNSTQTHSNSKIQLPLPSHVKYISSTSNPFVKHCNKLRLPSSYRHSHAYVLLVGATPIREILEFQKSLLERTVMMDCLLLPENCEVPEWINDLSVRVVQLSAPVIQKLSGMQSTESIEAMALMRIPTSFSNINADENVGNCRAWFLSSHRILVLDGIQDPGILGTLLRSATAFRWNGAFLLPGCCDPFNDKALRASRGASFQLPLVSGTWNHLESFITECRTKMLAGHPKTHNKSKQLHLSQKLANSLSEVPLSLVLGSEGSGLSEQSGRHCELVTIPMAGEFESLNVSVAGGIFLYMLQPQTINQYDSFQFPLKK